MKESEEDIIAAHDEKGGESLVSVILSKYRIVDGKEEMVAKYGLPGKEIEKAENSYVEAVCDGPVSNVVPEFKVVDGVADIEIHAEVFEDVEPLWKSFVVGYFMGDSPLIGSIHATVNRIWSMPKSKIDVQFISKRTVLFRIEDEQMRKRVLRRKYWHIADVPLVVSEWNPETAHDPPDLTAIPLWVDLVNVPGYLYSLEGLTFLSRTTWKFVKLHTNTERFARMDVPTVLVEVNLMKPLPEKICFKDKNQGSITVEVKYPWLPPRCTSCNGWGHIMIDCTKNLPIVLQRKQSLEKQYEESVTGKEVVLKQSLEKQIGESATGKEVVLKLLDDLERVDVRKQNLNMRKENNLQLVEVDPVEDVELREPDMTQEEDEKRSGKEMESLFLLELATYPTVLIELSLLMDFRFLAISRRKVR